MIQERRNGQGANWASNPDSNAPTARPAKLAAQASAAAAALFLSGSSSAIQAVAAPETSPVANPLNARATNNQTVSVANTKTQVLNTPAASPARTAFRRPIWS